MKEKMFRDWTTGLILAILIVIGGILQGSSTLTIGGVTPNIVLSVIIATTIIKGNDMIYRILIGALGVITLQVSPIEAMTLLALVIVAALIIFGGKYLPGTKWANGIFLSIAGTSLFYILIDLQFVYKFALILGGEIIYNTFLTVGIVSIFQIYSNHEATT
jgi:hypothetical protein